MSTNGESARRIDLTNLPLFDSARTPGQVLEEQSVQVSTPIVPRLATSGHDVDWALVRALRQKAADQLADAIREREGLKQEDRHTLGRALIRDLLSEEVSTAMSVGNDITPEEQNKLFAAVFDALFGMGRLQPYVDDERLENIFVFGDEVILVHSDGTVENAPPVSDSDEELIDQIAFLALHAGEGRPFSQTHRNVTLDLPGGHRLAASAWDTPRPVIAIRRHRLLNIGFDDLHAPTDPSMNPMMTTSCADFLRAAIRARRSIIVSGGQDAGKTTFTRALFTAIDPNENIGTVETVRELHLDKLNHFRRTPIAWQARKGSGERTSNGDNIGEVTVDQLLEDSLKFGLTRLAVGEVTGPEILAMFKAMQSGAGSFATIHAPSDRATIDRLTTLAMSAGAHVTSEYARRQIAHNIDLIVHLKVRYDDTGKRCRYVGSILGIEAGEDAGLAYVPIYDSNASGALATPHTAPSWVGSLEDFGLNAGHFKTGPYGGR